MKKKKRKSGFRKSTSLEKLSRKGFRGHPVATIAFYGPDNKLATKAAVGIVENENDEDEAIEMKKWYSSGTDIRSDPMVEIEIIEFIEKKRVKSVAIAEGIIGCPHEEGIDYPEGETCPQCPFWENRDRFTGEIIQ